MTFIRQLIHNYLFALQMFLSAVGPVLFFWAAYLFFTVTSSNLIFGFILGQFNWNIDPSTETWIFKDLVYS